ncbi:glutamine--fructose-6-phosphate transaminase [Actinokineospora alba]|uniref:Glutamine--fructose-6-phosphate transaminase n=1 Tax=Actinokineospora alba TaxID=504798 RepID=A0A1H0SPH2_9PSEU|nr:SIS domain-containing protein [Actinokineospora alba]TDP66601.1 glutamine--fructose-6-phosphate transaminase [Actinokineospora alba]SDJ38687.1 glucosamine--fructose-6-phosphate aminotransferase (isomerizing) [Actinokineospora alba]SDP43671.1 glutamine--fructose-6-phosphate transaminase [Actinokineospora alba]
MTEHRPGESMRAEIDQQPAVFAGVMSRRGDVAKVGSLIAARRPRFALFAARGSSDHAALYAKYLTEVLLKLPAGLVSPSTTTLYRAEPDLTDVLYVTVSQSGGSPDLVEATLAARARGALTVAVTNTADSPLNEAAEFSVDVGAGPELAVAATKTYSATLLTLYLLVDAIRGQDGVAAHGIDEIAARALAAEGVEAAVARMRFADWVVCTGRGFSSATAAEAALKLAETSYVSARAYSGADLLHGPIAALDSETSVLAITSVGAGGDAMAEVIDVVRRSGADITTVGSAFGSAIALPRTAEEVAPIIEILPLQRLALELSLARGRDPDHPRGLSKITKTR